MRKPVFLGLAVAALLLPAAASSPALAHGGGLDGLWCHHNRSAGGYHCHRGSLAGQSFASKADAQRALVGGAQPAPSRRATAPAPSAPSPAPVTTPASPAGVPYDRSLYRQWIDADGDCQDTRQEVLLEESLIPVTFTDARECRVAEGLWVDPYTGRVFREPGKLDVDHMVPLAETHASGGHAWGANRRKAYANDLENPTSLIAVAAGANRSKGAKDPANWMPPNRAYWCEYIEVWQAVKARWELEADPAEAKAVDGIKGVCAEYRNGDTFTE